MIETVKKVEVCHWAKFHKNRLNCGRDIVIFIFFKMVATDILDFQNFNFQLSERSRVWNCFTVPNFVEIAQTKAEILRFFDFSRWRPPPSWTAGAVGRVTSVELRHRAKFRLNHSNQGRDMSFNIMLVWLENAYSRPLFGVFWGKFPPNNVTHRPNPKKDHPWAEPRHLSNKPRLFSY